MAQRMASAVEMRHSPADDALVECLARLRPWHDDTATAAALRAWTDARGWSVEDVQCVADELVKLGAYETELDAETIAGITAFMLVNVATKVIDGKVHKGRKPTDYGMDPIVGITTDARRAYLRRHGNQSIGASVEKAQYAFTVHQLMLHGVTERAARRWILRNPGVWPACTMPGPSLERPKPAPGVVVAPTRGIVKWRLFPRRCRTWVEFQSRHFAGDWPTPSAVGR